MTKENLLNTTSYKLLTVRGYSVHAAVSLAKLGLICQTLEDGAAASELQNIVFKGGVINVWGVLVNDNWEIFTTGLLALYSLISCTGAQAHIDGTISLRFSFITPNEFETFVTRILGYLLTNIEGRSAFLLYILGPGVRAECVRACIRASQSL